MPVKPAGVVCDGYRVIALLGRALIAGMAASWLPVVVISGLVGVGSGTGRRGRGSRGLPSIRRVVRRGRRRRGGCERRGRERSRRRRCGGGSPGSAVRRGFRPDLPPDFLGEGGEGGEGEHVGAAVLEVGGHR